MNNARIGNQKSYTIAVSAPLGSKVKNDVNGALEMLRGVAQAQDQINNSITRGIKGVPLKVIIADDENDPEIAKKIATELGDNPEILGVVGHYASGITLAAGEIYKNKELPTISPVSTSVNLSDFGQKNIFGFGFGNKYVFRTVPSDKEAATTLADYMLNKLNQKEAVVFYNEKSEYSKSLKNEFIKNVPSDSYDLSKPDFNAEKLIKGLKSQVSVLVLLADTTTLDNALEVVKHSGEKYQLLAGDDVYTPKTLAEWKKFQDTKIPISNINIAVPWHIGLYRQTEFVQKSQELWRGDINWRTAMSYDATRALITALQQKPSRTGVAEMLSSEKFTADGATEKVEFLASGDRKAMKSQLVQIQPGKRSGHDFDFVPNPR